MSEPQVSIGTVQQDCVHRITEWFELEGTLQII